MASCEISPWRHGGSGLAVLSRSVSFPFPMCDDLIAGPTGRGRVVAKDRDAAPDPREAALGQWSGGPLGSPYSRESGAPLGEATYLRPAPGSHGTSAGTNGMRLIQARRRGRGRPPARRHRRARHRLRRGQVEARVHPVCPCRLPGAAPVGAGGTLGRHQGAADRAGGGDVHAGCPRRPDPRSRGLPHVRQRQQRTTSRPSPRSPRPGRRSRPSSCRTP